MLRVVLLLGGAGGLEAGITIMALQNQTVPPTTNLDDPDPRCPLNFVRKVPLERRVQLMCALGVTIAIAHFGRPLEGEDEGEIRAATVNAMRAVLGLRRKAAGSPVTVPAATTSA